MAVIHLWEDFEYLQLFFFFLKLSRGTQVGSVHENPRWLPCQNFYTIGELQFQNFFDTSPKIELNPVGLH